MGHKCHAVFEAVLQAMAQTPRCRLIVGNLNSRLRNYFTLRRKLGGKYLCLLQFFLNHRTFMRTRVPERVGKSPRQLMTGQYHPHWLTPKYRPINPEYLRAVRSRLCYPKTTVFEPRQFSGGK